MAGKNAASMSAKNESGISILEAGDSYVTEDGRTGYYYNVKKVFDISQTDAKRQRQAQVHYDDRLLLSALIAISLGKKPNITAQQYHSP